jgi:hypothetical protein
VTAGTFLQRMLDDLLRMAELEASYAEISAYL